MIHRYLKITELTAGNPLHDERGFTIPTEALKEHLRKKRDFNEAADVFAESLGGRVIIKHGVTSLSVHGLYFEGGPEHPELWTKPDPKAGFSRRPRVKGARNVKGDALKQAHKVLLQRWKEEVPERLELDGQWLCAGYKAADLLFSGAHMVADLEGGSLYVASPQLPSWGANYVEITGGEYQALEMQFRDQPTKDFL